MYNKFFLYLILFLIITIILFLKKRRKKNIDDMSGLEFEEYIANVLKNSGYKVILTKSSHDFGADIIIKDLGINKIKLVIQLKRYSGNVPMSAVQEVFSAMYYYDADCAAVLTNNYYSRSAVVLADKIKVNLWDRSITQEILKGRRIEKLIKYYK